MCTWPLFSLAWSPSWWINLSFCSMRERDSSLGHRCWRNCELLVPQSFECTQICKNRRQVFCAGVPKQASLKTHLQRYDIPTTSQNFIIFYHSDGSTHLEVELFTVSQNLSWSTEGSHRFSPKKASVLASSESMPVSDSYNLLKREIGSLTRTMGQLKRCSQVLSLWIASSIFLIAPSMVSFWNCGGKKANTQVSSLILG